MKYRVVEIWIDGKRDHLELDIKRGRFSAWEREGIMAPLAGFPVIGSCADDYIPKFQAHRFHSIEEIEEHIEKLRHPTTRHELVIGEWEA